MTTPSLALALANQGARFSLQRLVLVGEHVGSALRRGIAASYGIPPVSLYAASEVVLGYQDPHDPALYRWDPERLYLEVLRDGRAFEHGTGELIVTRRYGRATPLVRYRLGDLVDLLPGLSPLPALRFLGRTGHAFSLATGVKVSCEQIDRFLDGLPYRVSEASFCIQHQELGTDAVYVLLGTDEEIDRAAIKARFESLTLEIADVVASGYLDVSVSSHVASVRTKRRIVIEESPWRL